MWSLLTAAVLVFSAGGETLRPTLKVASSNDRVVTMVFQMHKLPAGTALQVTLLENNGGELENLVDFALQGFADLRLRPTIKQREMGRAWLAEHRSFFTTVGKTMSGVSADDSELKLELPRCRSTQPMEVGDCLWQDTEYVAYMAAEGHELNITTMYLDGDGGCVAGGVNESGQDTGTRAGRNGTACLTLFVPPVTPFFEWEVNASASISPTGVGVHWNIAADFDVDPSLAELNSFHLWLLAGPQVGNGCNFRREFDHIRRNLRIPLSLVPREPMVLGRAARGAVLEGCFVAMDGASVCLQPNTVYGVVLEPQFKNWLGKTDILLIVTGDGLPKQAPTGLRTFSVSSTSVLLRWEPSIPAAGKIIEYEILMHFLTTPSDVVLINVNSTDADITTRVNASDNTTFGNICFDQENTFPVLAMRELKPFTYYAFRLREGTRLGLGPPSELFLVRTGSVVQPSAGSVVIEPGSSSGPIRTTAATAGHGEIKVSWKEPSPLLGKLLFYELAIIKDRDKEVNLTDTQVLHKCKCTKLVLRADLVPVGSPLRLRVVNDAGAGPWSDPPIDMRSRSIADVNSSHMDSTILAVVIMVPLVLVLLLIVAVAWRLRTRVMAPFRFPDPDPEWDIDRRHIHVSWREVLGRGAFGVVYRGQLLVDTPSVPSGTAVAVKTVTQDASYERMSELIQEAQRVKRLGRHSHPNVVSMYATCAQDLPLLLILELCPNGTLKSYVANPRLHMQLPDQKLLRMCLDVALGMQWLTSQGFVHCDLAARNCLLDANYRVKVSDFGLARDVHYMAYYRKKGQAFLPVRWMAPETLVDGKFTPQSDVWSFGVCVWEVFSFGGTPYEQLDNGAVIKFVVQGHRLEAPAGSLPVVADILQLCFRPGRTTFLALVERLTAETGVEIDYHSVYAANKLSAGACAMRAHVDDRRARAVSVV